MKWLIRTHEKRLMSYLDQYAVKLYSTELFLETRGWINSHSKHMEIFVLNFPQKPLRYISIGLSKWTAQKV